MRILATGKDGKTNGNDDIPLLETIVEEDGQFDETRYTDNRLETPLGPDALHKRLLRLARDARTAEDEQGIIFCSWPSVFSRGSKTEIPT